MVSYLQILALACFALCVLADKEVDGKVEEWMEKQSDRVQTKYKQFMMEQKAMHVEAIALHKKIATKYSPEAKEADSKILAIMDDKKIQGEEKSKKIAEILKSYPESVRNELGSFAKASNDAAIKATSSDVKGAGSGKPAGAGWATSANGTEEATKEEQEANYIIFAFMGARRGCGCYNHYRHCGYVGYSYRWSCGYSYGYGYGRGYWGRKK